MHELWPARLSVPPLELDSIHVWRVRVRSYGRRQSSDAGAIAGMSAHLTASERARMLRFRFGIDRARFATARGLVRELLGHYVGLPPALVPLRSGPSGKPELDVEPHDEAGQVALRFNVSHAGDWALVALARGREVGVDVEQARPMSDLSTLASRFFASEEVAALDALDPPAREAAFFRIWTRKEAFLKATGDGIVAGLDRFTVSLDEDRMVRLQLAGAPSPPAHPDWTIRALLMPKGYAAAVAFSGSECVIRQWEWWR